MIQRMQSLHLLISAGTAIFYIFYTSITNLKICSAICALIFFGLIFLFKNRKLQFRLCNIAIAAILVLFALIFYSFKDDLMAYSIHFAFPVIMLINVLLAMNNIQKDEELVRSVDRIR